MLGYILLIFIAWYVEMPLALSIITTIISIGMIVIRLLFIKKFLDD